MGTSLEDRLTQIENRNKRVERDKDWEKSWTRRSLLAVLTYIVVVVYSWWIGGAHPFIQALVPVFGYVISTLTISVAKRRWEKTKSSTF